MMPLTRVCKKCGEEKPLEEFRAKNGRICDECQKDLAKKNQLEWRIRQGWTPKKKLTPGEKRRSEEKSQRKYSDKLKQRTKEKYEYPTRVCKKCRETKNKEEYSSQGFMCSACTGEARRRWGKNNKEKISKYQSNHYSKYQEKLLSQKRLYDLEHKREKSVRDKKRRDANPMIDIRHAAIREFNRKLGWHMHEIPEELLQYKILQIEFKRKIKNHGTSKVST